MPRLKPIHHEEQLPVVDHLDELRSRLMVAGAAFLVAFGLTTWQSDLVLAILNAPLPGNLEPITLGPAEPFITTLKTAGYAAVLLCCRCCSTRRTRSSPRPSTRASDGSWCP